MSSPNIRPGTIASLPAKFFVSAGPGMMIALPGVKDIKIKNTVDKVEDEDASILQKNDRATYQKFTGTVTVTGRTQDFISWINGYSASTTVDAFDVVEDISVVAGAGVLTQEPFSEAGDMETICLLNSDGLPLQQVTGTPGTGEYSVVGDVLTVGDAPTGTYIAAYLASSLVTPTGTKFELDFSGRPLRCSKAWIGGYTVSPETLVKYAGDKGEIMELKNVLFHSDLPIYDAKTEQATYELNFTANIWAQDDLLHYMVADPEAPTV